MKVCIFGAGAIGGWIGANLAKHGHIVSVVARGLNLDAIKAQGLTLQPAQGLPFTQKVFASANPGELGAQDLVIVSVKAQAMPEVAKAIGPLFGPNTMVLSAMNGVPWWFFDGFAGQYQGTQLKSIDPEGIIAKAIPAARTIGCVVHASCSTPAPGKVHQHFGNKLIVGSQRNDLAAPASLGCRPNRSWLRNRANARIAKRSLVQTLGQYDNKPHICNHWRHHRQNT